MAEASPPSSPCPAANSLAFTKRLQVGSPQSDDRVRRRLALLGRQSGLHEGHPPAKVSLDVGTTRCSPVASPSKRDQYYSDRFIPARAGNQWSNDFNMIQVRTGNPFTLDHSGPHRR